MIERGALSGQWQRRNLSANRSDPTRWVMEDGARWISASTKEETPLESANNCNGDIGPFQFHSTKRRQQRVCALRVGSAMGGPTKRESVREEGGKDAVKADT